MSNLNAKQRKRDVGYLTREMATIMNTRLPDPYDELERDLRVFMLNRLCMFNEYDANMDINLAIVQLSVATALTVHDIASIIGNCEPCTMIKTADTMHMVITDIRTELYPDHDESSE